MRNKFDERYFPLKRSFRLRSAKYRRCRDLRMPRTRFPGKKLTLRTLLFPAPHAGLKGKKIVFISDWHWHNSERNRQLLAEFTELMEKISPDLLLLGGDLCDDAEYLDFLPPLLEKLASLAPEVIAVMGNWETGKRWLPENFFAELYAKHGITMLENSEKIVSGMRIFGLADLSSINFHRLPEPPHEENIANILLVHSPDGVISADSKGFLRHFPLAFCGHNHGGQIRLPLIGALFCPSFYFTKFDSGIFERRGLKIKMVVSAGIGEHSHSRRIFCPPEMILTEFQ